VRVLAGAESYSYDSRPAVGGSAGTPERAGLRAGALLCHGFTSSPQSLRGWGEALAAAGLDVRVPRLPGHGTTWREMALTNEQDWYAAVRRSLADLRRRCDLVVVMGLSMGGTLALRLAETRPVDGLVLVNPSLLSLRPALRALPLARGAVRSVRGIAGDIARPGAVELAYDRVPVPSLVALQRLWAATRADLHRIDVPVLLLRSAVDHVVEPVNGELVRRSVRGPVTEVALLRSHHVATLDHDADLVAAESLAFVRRLVADREREVARG
jgi:carboxylesterase